jgi:hypothetical protein
VTSTDVDEYQIIVYEHDENPSVVSKSGQNLTAEMNHLKEKLKKRENRIENGS